MSKPFLFDCSAMSSKNVIANLTMGDKLNEKNYDIWHRKMQYLLNEQGILETLTIKMTVFQKATLPNSIMRGMSMTSGSRRIKLLGTLCCVSCKMTSSDSLRPTKFPRICWIT